MITSSILIVYLVLCVLDCMAAEQNGPRVLKPLLMPILAGYFVISAITRGVSPVLIVLITVGLVFGCLGDVFLLPDGKGFVWGAIAFLIGHIFYIASAWADVFMSVGGMSFIVLIPIPFYVICGILLSGKIIRGVPAELKMPVSLYIIVILAMSYSMCCRMALLFPAEKGPVISFIGSVFFMASDFILASAAFRKTSEKGIMETYVAAQFLIAQGFLLVF